VRRETRGERGHDLGAVSASRGEEEVGVWSAASVTREEKETARG
jgi:hypothetical protein